MVQDVVAEYRQLLRRVDRWFADCVTSAGPQIACSEGCCGCCRGLFDITLLDAYLLQIGFRLLPSVQREQVMKRVNERVEQLHQLWPQLHPPYILNTLPHQQWQQMPENDQTPCPLLGADGLCMVYDYRPLTCRLHGVPHVDFNGEVFSDSSCTLNFCAADPMTIAQLRAPFRQFFQLEVELLHRFSEQVTGWRQAELDTFIPTALLIDFAQFSSSDVVVDVRC